MARNKRFLMIDGSSLLFRAFYAIRDLRTQDGVYTNGVYGFMTMFWKAMEEIHPDYVLVAFDRSEPTFRSQIYADYKGTRQTMPPELGPQFGMVKDILRALSIKTIDKEGYEADDIIGTMSKRAEKAGVESILLTGDRDYFQLVSDLTTVHYTKRGISQVEEVDPQYIMEKYQVSPPALIEIKGLQGDASDNIPGVPGVGEKTAIKLVKEFSTIEKIYENIDRVSGKKLRENLLDNKDQAFFSRQLGEIFRDMPLEENREDFRPGDPDREELVEIFSRLEFRTFADRYALDDKKREILSFSTKEIAPPAWPGLAKKLAKLEKTSFAILGDGENYIHAKPVYACFQCGQEALLLDLDGREETFRESFSPLFSGEGPLLLAYDIKESMVLLKKMGLDFTADYRDIMLMEYLLDPTRSSYEIDNLAQRISGISILSRRDLLGKGAKRKEFNQIPRQDLMDYVGGLLRVVMEGEDKLWAEIKEMKMDRLYLEIENPLAQVLAHMEITGVAVDKAKLDALDKEYSHRLKEMEEEIYDYAGRTFNINSSQQLSDLLFVDLGLPPGKKTKTGYSTAKDVLEGLVDAHPIIPAILEYRMLSKLMSTYVDGFRPYIDPDGRVRSQFKQNVVATGRLSSTEPNLQNIPVRTEEGRKLRAVFVAGKGEVLVDADYSQIELRVLASLSGDPTMIRSFKEGHDIHTKTASEILGKDPDQVTANERSSAKAVNFGIIYGISDYGLSQNLRISRQAAKEYIDGYKATYPEIQNYMTNIVEEAKEKGYVETHYGRRRTVPELASSNFNVRSFGERIALNTPIQGTAADIIKLAMIKVDRALRDDGGKARLVLQIHDELIVEVEENHAEAMAKKIKQIMEEVSDLAVDLLADTNIGKSWYEAK